MICLYLVFSCRCARDLNRCPLESYRIVPPRSLLDVRVLRFSDTAHDSIHVLSSCPVQNTSPCVLRATLDHVNCCRWMSRVGFRDAAYISLHRWRGGHVLRCRTRFEHEASHDHGVRATLAFRFLRGPIAVSAYIEEL